VLHCNRPLWIFYKCVSYRTALRVRTFLMIMSAAAVAGTVLRRSSSSCSSAAAAVVSARVLPLLAPADRPGHFSCTNHARRDANHSLPVSLLSDGRSQQLQTGYVFAPLMCALAASKQSESILILCLTNPVETTRCEAAEGSKREGDGREQRELCIRTKENTLRATAAQQEDDEKQMPRRDGRGPMTRTSATERQNTSWMYTRYLVHRLERVRRMKVLVLGKAL
jgi:hypothetical protein